MVHEKFKNKQTNTHLEIRVKETESPDWIELLNCLDKAIATEGPVVRALDAQAGPSIEGLDNHDTVGVQALIPDCDRLQGNTNQS